MAKTARKRRVSRANTGPWIVSVCALAVSFWSLRESRRPRMDAPASIRTEELRPSGLKPRLRAYLWNAKEKLEIPESRLDLYSDNETKTLVPMVKLETKEDGRAYFGIIVDNVGEKDLLKAHVSVSCNVPIETTTEGEITKSVPTKEGDPAGGWTITFSRPVLNPYRITGFGAHYEFSTQGPFPSFWAPEKKFGCFISVRAPGLPPFLGGGLLKIVDAG